MGLGRQWADRLYKKNLKTHSHRSQSVLGQHDARYQCQSFPFRRRLANDELFCLLNPLLCKSSGVLTRQVMVSPHEWRSIKDE
ncbi:hypothetical protein OUZ56_031316 [Daphnia magna]|uniref:Uncharacterized protein n=1 Tax=Daphnia magna TaxID=35525 RepID=A0ABQ9ZTW6_9CRUS|nr:hypothetical protein OUZ56_031316 [Daphnia magna]